MKFDISEFLKKFVHKIQVSLKYDLTCTLHKDLYTSMVVSL